MKQPDPVANGRQPACCRCAPQPAIPPALLRDVPGVSLYGAGGVSSMPVIHGLADDRLRITGRRHGSDLASCPNHMNPPLSYLDPSNVANVKVFAGITPVSVGGDSIGGAIVAETARTAIRRAGPGHAGQGRSRRLLPQQQQRPGRQPVGHAGYREHQRQLHRRHGQGRQLQGRRRLQELWTSTGRIGHTPRPATKSAPPPTKAAPTPSASP